MRGRRKERSQVKNQVRESVRKFPLGQTAKKDSVFEVKDDGTRHEAGEGGGGPNMS